MMKQTIKYPSPGLEEWWGGGIAFVVCMTQKGVESIMGLMSVICNQNRLKLVPFLRYCLDNVEYLATLLLYAFLQVSRHKILS